MPSEPGIRFVPVTKADLPMLRGWLEQPHMREWWGEVDTELGYIRDMVEGRDPTRPFIFHVDDEPAGFIQVWSVDDAIRGGFDAEAPWLHELPGNAVGVDLSIGDPDRLSRGIGTRVLREFVSMLIGEGHDMIVIDPDESNARAVRAYEKVGFVPLGRYPGEKETTLLMRLDRSKLTENAP